MNNTNELIQQAAQRVLLLNRAHLPIGLRVQQAIQELISIAQMHGHQSIQEAQALTDHTEAIEDAVAALQAQQADETTEQEVQ